MDATEWNAAIKVERNDQLFSRPILALACLKIARAAATLGLVFKCEAVAVRFKKLGGRS